MFKKNIIPLIFTFSFLFGGLKVPISELVLRDQVWFYHDSEIPFTGTAFMVSDQTGSITQQTNYIDGLAWGKYYEWWPNGEKKVNGTYRFDLMFGRWKFFYENGKIASAGSYNNGGGHDPRNKLGKVPRDGINGLWTYWNENGRKVEEGYYNKNGNEKGNWAFWDIDGKKHLGKKISHETFENKNTLKHLNGIYLVANSFNDSLSSFTSAHGSIRDGVLDGLWTFWHENGFISSKRYFKKGSPNGQFRTYHEKSGKKIEDGIVSGYDDYGNLVKDGKWMFFDSTGLLKEEVLYDNGVREGLTTLFSPSGNQKSKLNYKKSVPWNGNWTTWYLDGQKKESGLYENGEKKSPWISWFTNGQKKHVINFQNNLKHGSFTEWNKDGRLIKDINYRDGTPVTEYLVSYKGEGYTEINKKDGKLAGFWISWYSNGKKREEGFYKDNKKSGNWDGWYSNGEKKYSAKFNNGGAEGIYTELDKNGQVTKSIEYHDDRIISEYHVTRDDTGILEYHKKDGILDGLWTKWYTNGQKAEEGSYKNGKKNGKWGAWFPSSTFKYTGEYLNGKRSGKYLEWNKKGKKSQEILYSNGKRIEEYLIINDSIGFMEINKKYGILEGQWVKWYSEGKKEEEGVYDGGKKIGNWSKYNRSGIVLEEWNYDSQGRNLYEITYYDNGTVKMYCDYFSKTIQKYNSDGSIQGEKTSF